MSHTVFTVVGLREREMPKEPVVMVTVYVLMPTIYAERVFLMEPWNTPVVPA